jgi:hypothetical protein
MSLSKVEDLTNILIDRGYIIPPRSHRRRAAFRERSELLVMSALYILGSGAAFRSCNPLCGISTSEVQKFFYIFIEALVDMKEEYIFLPRNLTELNRVNKDYSVAGLPGCVGLATARSTSSRWSCSNIFEALVWDFLDDTHIAV